MGAYIGLVMQKMGKIVYVGNAGHMAGVVRQFVDDAYIQYGIPRDAVLDVHIHQASPDGCVFVRITGRGGRYVIPGRRNGIKSISGVLCRICGKQLLCTRGVYRGMCHDCRKHLYGGGMWGDA